MARKYSEEERIELLDSWDQILTFETYGYGDVPHGFTPAELARWDRSFEITDMGLTYDEWVENRQAGLIEEYSKMTGLTYAAAQAELNDRPVKKPSR